MTNMREAIDARPVFRSTLYVLDSMTRITAQQGAPNVPYLRGSLTQLADSADLRRPLKVSRSL